MKCSKEMWKVITFCEEKGCTVVVGKKHNKIVLPTKHVISFSITPSDHNAHRQVIRDLRRAGFDISKLNY